MWKVSCHHSLQSIIKPVHLQMSFGQHVLTCGMKLPFAYVDSFPTDVHSVAAIATLCLFVAIDSLHI